MLALGIDFGTSGVRAIAIDLSGQIVAESRYRFALGELIDVAGWQKALWQVMNAIAPSIRTQVFRIAINGTSATMLLCNQASECLTPPLLYNDARARSTLVAAQAIAPLDSPALSATSTLVKALWLFQQGVSGSPANTAGVMIVHQADWLAHCLHGQLPMTDYHNALKLGYDVKALTYPDWLLNSPVGDWLPDVLEPGEAIAPILPTLAERFAFPPTCQICAGTTDSIAAFLASGAHQPGEAVTSLGSTLVLKLLSPHPVDNQSFGIYSHRLGALWLVGGASNTGGAVLQQYFSAEQLTSLSAQIDISQPCQLDYYPLNQPGERFPFNDPDYSPRLTPRPEQDHDFLYGLLDGMSRIEAEGYQKLVDLGAPMPRRIYTAGGGSQNVVWQALRQRRLGVDVTAAPQTEAAYGTAQLAMKGLTDFT